MITLKSWWEKKFGPDKFPPSHRPRNATITMLEWRQNPNYVSETKKFLDSDFGKALLDMLQNSHPLNMESPDQYKGVTDPSTAQLYKIRGYELCLRRIQLAATSDPNVHEPMVSTFSKQD